MNIFPEEEIIALEIFKEFKALVENQIEERIKVLRTDNGGVRNQIPI
jgi:hypothetical protein